MSKQADITITVIPSSGPRRRTILFNARATDQLLRNLDYFALRNGLSQATAREIARKYMANLSEISKDQKEYDLGSIAFFLNVSILHDCVVYVFVDYDG